MIYGLPDAFMQPAMREVLLRLQVYAELTPKPIAAASLGQVYKGKLKSGETVAVKVQRPYVVETVSIDLFIIRQAPVSFS